MVMTDPIADMLTRIRNANQRRHSDVIVPLSNTKKAIADVLKAAGYIRDFSIEGTAPKQDIKITLKYDKKNKVIQGIKRISKPGLRVYANVNELPRVLSGLGIAIVSTSKGIMSDDQARKEKLGGEVLAYVW